MIDHTNVCILKRVVVQNYFLNIVVLSPSLGLEFCSVVALFYPTEWNFMQKKQCYLDQHLHILLLLHFFFIPEGSLLLFSALAIFYFISFTYYMTHSNKSITVVPEFKNNKKATFDD